MKKTQDEKRKLSQEPTTIHQKGVPAFSKEIWEKALAETRRKEAEDAGPPVLPSFDVAGVAAHLRDNACSNVIVMCGAGISVSAGIPDFRSPGTGLYDNLQAYDLPSPQSIFELGYFRERPDAFYRLCAELWPDNYAPTPTHHFLCELHELFKLFILRFIFDPV